jgi:hypothetical protein
MKKLIPILAIALLLAGCSAGQTTKPTPSPTATATPTIMPTADAAAYYLKTVCPANQASLAVTAALNAQDIGAIKIKAAAARDAFRLSAQRLEASPDSWPLSVRKDVKTLADADYALVSTFDTFTRATTIDEALAVQAPADNGSGAAAQRIRAHLNLPADTSQGC